MLEMHVNMYVHNMYVFLFIHPRYQKWTTTILMNRLLSGMLVQVE